MTEETIEKARKVVAAPGFRWMPGMRVRDTDGNPGTVVWARAGADWGSTFRVFMDRDGEGFGPRLDPTDYRSTSRFVLDLDAPATFGCLYALLRERLGERAHIDNLPTGKLPWGLWGRRAGSSRLTICFLDRYPSEIEALLAGLGVTP